MNMTVHRLLGILAAYLTCYDTCDRVALADAFEEAGDPDTALLLRNSPESPAEPEPLPEGLKAAERMWEKVRAAKAAREKRVEEDWRKRAAGQRAADRLAASLKHLEGLPVQVGGGGVEVCVHKHYVGGENCLWSVTLGGSDGRYTVVKFVVNHEGVWLVNEGQYGGVSIDEGVCRAEALLEEKLFLEG